MEWSREVGIKRHLLSTTLMPPQSARLVVGIIMAVVIKTACVVVDAKNKRSKSP
jgi:hypothetical protein